METISLSPRSNEKRNAVGIAPKRGISRQDTLFCCDNCFSSIRKENCNTFFFCDDCKLKICTDCFTKSNKCINCDNTLMTFKQKEKITIPDDMHHFIPIKVIKKQFWCCC